MVPVYSAITTDLRCKALRAWQGARCCLHVSGVHQWPPTCSLSTESGPKFGWLFSIWLRTSGRERRPGPLELVPPLFASSVWPRRPSARSARAEKFQILLCRLYPASEKMRCSESRFSQCSCHCCNCVVFWPKWRHRKLPPNLLYFIFLWYILLACLVLIPANCNTFWGSRLILSLPTCSLNRDWKFNLEKRKYY